MKTLKGKTLMSILYAVILSIPMISILSRVIYVQSNKNAYQSYYGETINETTFTPNALNDTSKEYVFNNSLTSYSYNAFITYQINVNNVKVEGSTLDYTTINNLLFIGADNTTQVIFRENTTNVRTINLNAYTTKIYFTYLNKDTNNSLFENIENYFYLVNYNKYSYLDNVFDYSVSKLVDEQNFGQLNFFQWFGNLFLNDAQSNMLYVRFVNWYLNYALLVSLMQIIFLCLMWFVNFSRRLLERGMNYDW